jgi:hypothetical protein
MTISVVRRLKMPTRHSEPSHTASAPNIRAHLLRRARRGVGQKDNLTPSAGRSTRLPPSREPHGEPLNYHAHPHLESRESHLSDERRLLRKARGREDQNHFPLWL